MKIKTAWALFDQVLDFDEMINAYLEEGWVLRKREVLQGVSYTDTAYARRALYAELEPPDKEETIAEPEPRHPFEAVQELRAYCRSMSGLCQGCQLHNTLCGPLGPWRKGPAEWTAPVPEGKA